MPSKRTLHVLFGVDLALGKCNDTFGMTFVVQTQIDVFFNDRKSEFDGFEPLTVGLTLWVDLNFRDQMFHQLFFYVQWDSSHCRAFSKQMRTL